MMLNRNIILVLLAQPLLLAIAPMLILIGGLMGLHYAPAPELATLPIAFMVIGTAVAASPAAAIYRRLGRRNGALVGTALAFVGALVGMAATLTSNFVLLCLATAFSGAAIAFAQQLRFAAVESLSNANLAPKVLSALLLANLVSAFIGPEIGSRGANLLATPYLGAFALLAGLSVMAALLLSRFDNQTGSQANQVQHSVPWRQLFANPNIILAIAASAIGFAVMTFVMTATPLSMQHGSGHSDIATKWVIQSHIIAMFLPSIVTPKLINRFGTERVMMAGMAAYVAVLLVALSGQAVMHYWWTLVLLGIGWNFLFLSGNSLLARSYQPEEATTAQGLNDTLVFSAQAVASLSAGVILTLLGWQGIIWLSLPATLSLLALLVWCRRQRAR